MIGFEITWQTLIDRSLHRGGDTVAAAANSAGLIISGFLTGSASPRLSGGPFEAEAVEMPA